MKTCSTIWLAAGVAALMLAPACLGEVGDLKFSDKPIAGPSEQGQQYVYQFGTAPDNCGTKHPYAVVGETMGRGPAQKMYVAIDAKSPDAKKPDLIRFNFGGKLTFNDKDVLPLRESKTPMANSQQMEFGPAVMTIQQGGKDFPVAVHGTYMRQADQRWLQLGLVVAAEGTCRFGPKDYPVRLKDGNGNMSLGDAAKPMVRAGKVMGLQPGDEVIVDTGDGSFTKDVLKLSVGHLTRVDGAWYKLEVDAAAMKIKAVPVEAQTGQVRIDHEEWSATLVGKEHILKLGGDKKPIDVPAGQYVVLDYQEVAPADAAGRRGRLMRSGQRDLYQDKLKPVDVAAGKTTEIAVGSPLKAVVAAAVKGRTVTFTLQVQDASGVVVDYAMSPEGKRLPEPKVIIADAAGKEIYRCTLEYG